MRTTVDCKQGNLVGYGDEKTADISSSTRRRHMLNGGISPIRGLIRMKWEQQKTRRSSPGRELEEAPTNFD